MVRSKALVTVDVAEQGLHRVALDLSRMAGVRVRAEHLSEMLNRVAAEAAEDEQRKQD